MWRGGTAVQTECRPGAEVQGLRASRLEFARAAGAQRPSPAPAAAGAGSDDPEGSAAASAKSANIAPRSETLFGNTFAYERGNKRRPSNRHTPARRENEVEHLSLAP